MIKKIALLTEVWILTFIFAAGGGYAQSGWVQTEINPGGGYSLCATGSAIFAGTQQGVYSTTDNGMPWISKGPVDHSASDIIESHQYILVYTDHGVYRSSDNGDTWLPTNGSPSVYGTGGVIGPHLFAKNSSYVFVIAWASGIFRSSDDGQNWEQIYVGQDGYGYQDYAAAATCITSAGENIIFGRDSDYPYEIYSTSDNGDTWTGSKISRSDGRFDQLLCLYNDNGKLYASGFMGVYLSRDMGNSWSTQYTDTVGAHGELLGLGIFRDIISYDQKLIAAVDFRSIQISSDNGKSWTSFNDGLISDWTFGALAIKQPYIWGIRQYFGNVYRRSLTEVVTKVEHIADLPDKFSLSQNYPNPFNPSTKISYSIPQESFVTLKVYDIIGKEIVSIVNEEKPAGNYEVEFSVKGFTSGNSSDLSSGVYFYRIQASSFTATKKFILMK